MSGPASDPYIVLGVSRQASPSEIARAYRRAARATHPDSRPDDPSAAERFRNVSAAYEISATHIAERLTIERPRSRGSS
jgi:curved DNA-binding protein CbpA